MTDYFKPRVIVYARNLNIARDWAKVNVHGSERQPTFASPENLSVFLGMRNTVIICVNELPPDSEMYRILGHGNLLITTVS